MNTINTLIKGTIIAELKAFKRDIPKRAINLADDVLINKDGLMGNGITIYKHVTKTKTKYYYTVSSF